MASKINKKILNFIGQLLMLASLVFIVVKVAQYDIDFRTLVTAPIIITVLLSALAFGLSTFLTAFNFRWLLWIVANIKVKKKMVVDIYCHSNLYKYLPGNIMHLVGRNRLALETEELSHSQVAFATIIDNIFLCLAAVIIAAICVFDYLLSYVAQISISPLFLILAGSAILLILFLVIIFRQRLGKIFSKYFMMIKSLKPRVIIKLLLVCSARLLVLALTYLATLVVLGQTLSASMIPEITGLFVLSWVVGFLTPGAPGGLGIREAIMLMFMGGVLDANILLLSTLVHRVICILGDLIAYGLAIIYTNQKS